MGDKGGEGADAIGSSGKELALLPVPYPSSATGTSSSHPADAASSNYYVYPPQLAKYEDILASPKVFMTTLEKLHATMRTKFMIPIIGGKELDLHRLFVEVTSRGGIEKVVRERRWKEITSVFKFPSTATNASFILRKYYVSLIHHYEQLYFFGAKGWNRSDPDLMPAPSPTAVPVPNSVEPLTSSEPPSVQQLRKGPPLGSPVVGIIDGKFEHGYLVTVSVGTQKLHGVLYHISDHQTGQYPYFNANNNGKGTTPLVVRRRRRRKKSEIKRRDPAHPKPNRSGYNFFFQEQHARLKPLHPGKDREISKMIGELWSNLTETEKAVYQEKGVKDKERYQFEMQEYRAGLKRGEIISNAVPIQQRQGEPEAVKVEPDNKMEAEEDESDEDDQMDADSPHTPDNGSSLGESDSDEKLGDKDSETALSVETENTVNVVAVGMEISVEPENRTEVGNNVKAGNDDFELRKRDQKIEGEPSVQDLNL